jgi:hypothetical protein
MKLTKWHEGHMKPEHPGVYQVKVPTEGKPFLHWSYWNGKHWSWSFQDILAAAAPMAQRTIGVDQAKAWRAVKK